MKYQISFVISLKISNWCATPDSNRETYGSKPFDFANLPSRACGEYPLYSPQALRCIIYGTPSQTRTEKL